MRRLRRMRRKRIRGYLRGIESYYELGVVIITLELKLVNVVDSGAWF